MVTQASTIAPRPRHRKRYLAAGCCRALSRTQGQRAGVSVIRRAVGSPAAKEAHSPGRTSNARDPPHPEWSPAPPATFGTASRREMPQSTGVAPPGSRRVRHCPSTLFHFRQLSVTPCLFVQELNQGLVMSCHHTPLIPHGHLFGQVCCSSDVSNAHTRHAETLPGHKKTASANKDPASSVILSWSYGTKSLS